MKIITGINNSIRLKIRPQDVLLYLEIFLSENGFALEIREEDIYETDLGLRVFYNVNNEVLVKYELTVMYISENIIRI